MTYFEFLSKEKPSNIFVDEAPLEISWLAHIKLLPMSTLFTMNQPLIVGIVKLVALYIISFPPCLIFSNFMESYYPIISWLFILLGSIQWLIMSASEGSYSVSKTTDVLKSIADQLSDSSSFLWIALQSNYLHDYGNLRSQITKKDIKECRKMLAGKNLFHCPILRRNLRNSKAVSDINFYTCDGAIYSESVDMASIPKAPPSLSSSESEEWLYIPLSSISKLKDAVSYAYNHKVFGKPKVVVVILDDEKLLDDVVAGLSLTGLEVVTYYTSTRY